MGALQAVLNDRIHNILNSPILSKKEKHKMIRSIIKVSNRPYTIKFNVWPEGLR